MTSNFRDFFYSLSRILRDTAFPLLLLSRPLIYERAVKNYNRYGKK